MLLHPDQAKALHDDSAWSNEDTDILASIRRTIAREKRASDPNDKPHGWFMTRGEWNRYKEVAFPIRYGIHHVVASMTIGGKAYSVYRLDDGDTVRDVMLYDSPRWQR